ncbi:GerAB/ArcD/ProY family transporter [Paenibacillus sp. CF384]|uniref:GerAB/ArcD/ProY family transporter n=1 Tax=Paenibacillus sp. CF384 TaxID=1884382 RepID=UPI000898539A|nr:GerAB/ArcD/ProY family transporter [Paenibacillus sp. CF384]SDW02791.1 spore germination protein (amino acid permease) [Paenibacillus sp. CF384]
MQHLVKENDMVSGFFLFFLFHASLLGAGVLGFQHLIVNVTGNDAWISVVIMGLTLHVIIWMIFKMLGSPAKDLIDLHRILFGKILGNAISLVMVGYYFLLALIVFRGYIEIIHIWMFPDVKTWILALILIVAVYYAVSGGFRVIAGYCLFGVFFSTLLPLLLYFNIKYGHLYNVMPIFNHSIKELITSSKFSGILFMGFETILLYFPFIKAPEKNVKWAHLGLFYCTIKYALLMFVTLMYFSQGLLKHTYWPTLVMVKVIEFSLMARVEFIFICIWLMLIIPMLSLSVWSCTRIIKRVTNLKPSWSIYVILIAIFSASLPFNDRVRIEWLGRHVVELGFYFIYGYIPLLFILYLIRSLFSQRKPLRSVQR